MEVPHETPSGVGKPTTRMLVNSAQSPSSTSLDSPLSLCHRIYQEPSPAVQECDAYITPLTSPLLTHGMTLKQRQLELQDPHLSPRSFISCDNTSWDLSYATQSPALDSSCHFRYATPFKQPSCSSVECSTVSSVEERIIYSPCLRSRPRNLSAPFTAKRKRDQSCAGDEGDPLESSASDRSLRYKRRRTESLQSAHTHSTGWETCTSESWERIDSKHYDDLQLSIRVSEDTTECAATTAATRIKRLLEREASLRKRDGLPHIVQLSEYSPPEETCVIFGIQPALRMQIVRWILEVIPSADGKSTADLRKHLLSCSETRIHAIQLFCRYMHHVGDTMPTVDPSETPYFKSARTRTIWDVALGCLAISVKFHHDFLYPNYPIEDRALLVLGKHKIGRCDFELCQKDVLEVLSFEVWDISPITLLYDLEHALPSLQRLCQHNEGEGYWNRIEVEVRCTLREALLDCESLRFPVSLIIAAALLESLVSVLAVAAQDNPESFLRLQLSESYAEQVKEELESLLEVTEVSWFQDSVRQEFRDRAKSRRDGRVVCYGWTMLVVMIHVLKWNRERKNGVYWRVWEVIQLKEYNVS